KTEKNGKNVKSTAKKETSKKEEKPKTESTGKKKKSAAGNKKPASKTSNNDLPNIDKKDKEKEVKLDGHTFQLTSLDKIYWPQEGFTKGDVIRHYLDMSRYILP